MKKRYYSMTFFIMAMLCLAACTVTEVDNPTVEPLTIQSPEAIETPTDDSVSIPTAEPTVKPTVEQTEDPEEDKETEWYLDKKTKYNNAGEIDYEYQYDENKHLILEAYYINNEMSDQTVYEYQDDLRIRSTKTNSQGQVLSIKETNIDEKGRILPTRYEEYLDNGSLLEWNQIEKDETDPNKFIETAFYASGKFDYRKEYIYNENNNLIKESEYDVSGKLKNETEYWDNGKRKSFANYYDEQFGFGDSQFYEYDEDENCVRSVDKDEAGNITGWSEKEYVYEDGLKKEFSKMDYGASETWFDSQGRIVFDKIYDVDGNVERWSRSEYDEYGFGHTISINPEDGSELTSIDSYEDEDGNRVTVMYDNNGDVTEYCKIEFDECGRVICKSRGTDENDIFYRTRYTYDEYGNVICEYDDSGALSSKFVYEYLPLR